MRKKAKVITRTLLTLAAAVGLLLGEAGPTTAQGKSEIYGSQLMTEQERLEHRQRMQNAKTAEERERIRSEHHRRITERAKKNGVTLPDKPPAQGMQKGKAKGQGPGLGTGKGGGGRKGG